MTDNDPNNQMVLSERHICTKFITPAITQGTARCSGVESSIPLDVLSNYLAGAQIALLHWWLEKRRPHELEELAEAFHRLQRGAIRDAFGLQEAE